MCFLSNNIILEKKIVSIPCDDFTNSRGGFNERDQENFFLGPEKPMKIHNNECGYGQP